MNLQYNTIFDHIHPKKLSSTFNICELNHWINFHFSWICISMQKISLIHLFIFEKKSILESRDQNSHTHFWTCPPYKLLIGFWFLWSCINIQKISLFHLFTLQIQSILELHHMTCHTHFWPCQPLKFSVTFEFV